MFEQKVVDKKIPTCTQFVSLIMFIFEENNAYQYFFLITFW